MKNITIYPLILLILLLGSCNEFLNVAPDERLSINTLEKVEATVVGSYQNDRGFRFTHFSSDDVTLAKNVFDSDVIIEDLYTWSRNFRDQTHQDSPSAYWDQSYYSISQINHALEAYEKLEISAEEEEKAKAVKGEALIMRSYCHFMLVNLFAKHYDPATAKTDLGVPYVFVPEKQLIQKYKRETVETVYQLAEKDLQEGLALMEAGKGKMNKNKYRFTKQTAYNYASRFYTFRNKDAEDVKKAIQYGEQSIAAYGGAQQMRPWAEYKSDSNGPVDVEQAEVGLVQMSSTWVIYGSMYQSTNDIRDKILNENPYGLVDNRFLTWYKRGGDVFIPAYFFVGEGGSTAADLFPLAEAILQVAEGYIRQENYEKAKEMLSIIAGNVYNAFSPDYLTTNNLRLFFNTKVDKTAWTKYLLFERRNHFFLKGMRWFDLKRYNINVKHVLSNGKVLWLTQVAPDKDYQIPSYAIEAGLEPNK